MPAAWKPIRPLPLLISLLGAHSAVAADLTVGDVVSPSTIYAGTGSLVSFEVENLGTPLTGDYTVEVLLSADAVVDGGDLVIGSATHGEIGWQSVIVDTSPSTTPGGYFVGVRILPLPGETDTTNNDRIGDPVDLLEVLLAVDDASPINLMVHANEAESAGATLEVSNAGSPSTVLVFTAAPTSAAPWLQIDPPSGFSVAPDDAVEVTLKGLPAGLPQGPHSVTLRFQNLMVETDFTDVTVTLLVDDPKFDAGDRILGTIDAADDVDAAVFAGVKGEKLKLKLRSKKGDLKTQIDVVDPDGNVEDTLTWKHSGKFVKKTTKLSMSGDYTLRIGGKGSTTGSYDIKTGCSLPKLAEKRTVTLSGPDEAQPAEVDVLLLPGAELAFTLIPNEQFVGPLTLGLTTPSGKTLDLTKAEVVDGKVKIEGIVADEVGLYRLLVSGFGPSGQSEVTVKVKPNQPDKTTDEVVLP